MYSTLVSTAVLAEHPEWRAFDCRHDLAQPDLGESQYRKAHLPGALFAHLDRDLSAPKTGANGRHPLPERREFAQWLGRQGLKTSDQVVCYDAANGAMAARLWWMLRWVGHEAVAVLDGGLAKWIQERHPLSAQVPVFPPTSYPLRPALTNAVDVDFVARGRDALLLVDARSAVRFRGEQEPIDPVAGHIPGAKNRFNADNVAADGTFKGAEELKTAFLKVIGERDPAEVVHYCGSGVAACHNLLAMEVAGLPGGKLYAGSWSEWSADAKRPIAR